MALEAPGIDVGFVTANADLSAKQFFAVKMTGADFKVDVSVAATPSLGILQNKPTSGQAAQVRVLGVSKAVSGASYALGALLSSDANGKLITAATGTTAIAYALEAAAGANETRTVLVLGGASFKLP